MMTVSMTRRRGERAEESLGRTPLEEHDMNERDLAVTEYSQIMIIPIVDPSRDPSVRDSEVPRETKSVSQQGECPCWSAVKACLCLLTLNLV
jgi:hypothetical protein